MSFAAEIIAIIDYYLRQLDMRNDGWVLLVSLNDRGDHDVDHFDGLLMIVVIHKWLGPDGGLVGSVVPTEPN